MSNQPTAIGNLQPLLMGRVPVNFNEKRVSIRAHRRGVGDTPDAAPRPDERAP